MTFFESLLVLVFAAIALVQVSRRLALPYPAMLAGAGVLVAMVPGAPTIAIEPATTLALFITPALVDAAFDFPPGAASRFWAPLFALAIVAVLITAGLVAWLGWMVAGLPVAAALVLGAIVAPPDAAAATAVLRSVAIPRNTDAIIKGESLFNDATALLLFGEALAVQQSGGLHPGQGVSLALAAPGGLLLGIVLATLYRRVAAFVAGTLGGNVLQFVVAFSVWIIADRLHLSAILCVVAFAMTIARMSEVQGSVRMRVHSYAVWGSVVFVLNVFAFLMMGMQARVILDRMEPGRLREAFGFAGLVVLAVILVRIVVVFLFNRLAARRRRRQGRAAPTVRQAMFVGWCGMRGLVTLATAFALPATFPQRDLVVLTAFAVVLATLVIQGLTLAPLTRLLKLDKGETAEREMAAARADLTDSALRSLAGVGGPEADHVRYLYAMRGSAADDAPGARYRALGLKAIKAERERLAELRRAYEIDTDAFNILQEELDWRELVLLPDDDRRIEES